MIIQCPECELPVSDKAVSCPHCGFPMQKGAKSSNYHKSRRRRRLPNGFGQISEIKDKSLRKPFRAMITVGKTPEGRPICKPLKPQSYFATYNEAYEALVKQSKTPYEAEKDMTVNELFVKWYAQHETGETNARAIRNAWKYCSYIYPMRIADLRPAHIKYCLDEGTAEINGIVQKANPHVQKKIKVVLNMMYDYAVEYDLVERNYPRSFSIPSKISKEASSVKKEHIAYTDEEMNKLWANVETISGVDMLLIQCYSGWRPNELLNLKLRDIDLKNRTMIGGMKTDAGRDRTVPIHSKILSLVQRRYESSSSTGSEYLFVTPTRQAKYTYTSYHRMFTHMLNLLSLNTDHRPHDGRKQFVTMAKNCRVDEYAIKYIIGHTIQDITESTYTHREVSWLASEIEKIK